jgi:hypothetical protein
MDSFCGMFDADWITAGLMLSAMKRTSVSVNNASLVSSQGWSFVSRISRRSERNCRISALLFFFRRS